MTEYKCFGRRSHAAVWALAALCVDPASDASAKVWPVGPDQALTRPSEAAERAADGDTVTIAPGTYYDCAVWPQKGLTLHAAGPGVVLTDTVCAGKAIWVLTGDDATVVGVTFARARVPDGNGAGVRVEGRGLTLDHCVFDDDQVGLFGAGGGAVRVTGGVFSRNGQAVAVYRADELVVSGARVEATRRGDAIASAAARTIVRDSVVADTVDGAAGCLLSVDGDLDVAGTSFRKAAASPRPDCAILVGAAARTVRVAHSRLVAAPPIASTFVRNASSATPVLTDLATEGDVTLERGESARMVAGRLRRGLGAAVAVLRHGTHVALAALGLMR